MCVILSPNPRLFAADAESPPPMIVVPSTFANASQIAIVPFAKLGISKHPIGPFQTTVLAPLTASAKSSAVLGPMSRPSISAGISPRPTTLKFASFEKSSATVVSIGIRSLTPFSSAFFSISSAYCL